MQNVDDEVSKDRPKSNDFEIHLSFHQMRVMLWFLSGFGEKQFGSFPHTAVPG